MNVISPALIKNPVLKPAEDFYRLRRDGIGFIAEMGSENWTDYNVHDPGITILEAVCYAITDLAYRIGWKIEDILTPPTPSGDPLQPYPNQPFFTARKILTVNPTTTADFRRRLIDLPNVRDAWLVCKECACEASYFAWCENDQLMLDYQKPADAALSPREVWALGMYEVLLELESDPLLGDLNDWKIVHRSVLRDENGVHSALVELRFPDPSQIDREQWQLFLDSDAAFGETPSFTVALERLGATKTFDVFRGLGNAKDRDTYIRDHWRDVFYMDLEVEIPSRGMSFLVKNAALRAFGDSAVRSAATARGWKALFQSTSPQGFIQLWREKAKKRLAAVALAKAELQAHRNLDEDYCSVTPVGVEEVAVCADVEVEPDADIERVQAEIWFRLEQYFNPAVAFHTLQELVDAGGAVEDIFNGPALDNGFISPSDLEAASLRTVLRVSDMVDRLMGIGGVIAVNQLQLTKYDSEGNVVRGAADPSWANGQPVFDPNKASASWLLFVSSRHQPRFYLNLSRFLFFKNGLPFLPRMDEATDTLNQLRGEAERPKNPDAANDFPIPRGDYRDPEAYHPIQYSFPLAYGIGPSGLPSTASDQRRGQAKQLKAYLLVFEQLIGNALAQLAHTADLFALDPSIAHTYFITAFNESTIVGFDAIVQPEMSPAAVQGAMETVSEFQERRNRFLDHLLARFGEQFREYALLLTTVDGKQLAQQQLIEKKIAFLKACPEVSHDRAKAFNYRKAPCSPANYSGIKKRISLLLGYPDLVFVWNVGPSSGRSRSVSFSLIDGNRSHWLDGELSVAAISEEDAKQAAYRTIIERMIRLDAYDISAVGDQFRLELQDVSSAELGRHTDLFETKDAAVALRDALLAWSANERLIVVEHLLLRPKFFGDALYPACCEGECNTCGDEDPYSFRLTFVMPGWTPQYTDNLDLRRFAERTIQRETPSHLLGKTCWVGNDGFAENPCDEVISELADLLSADGLTAAGNPPSEEDACACANALYHAFSTVFTSWYEDKTLEFLHGDALDTLIGEQFQTAPTAAEISCTTVLEPALWSRILAVMKAHFVQIALHGWQFERFERAWRNWLDANAAIDWTTECLIDRVQAILRANLLTQSATDADLCECAKAILVAYGATFYQWMEDKIRAGTPLEDLPDLPKPSPIACPGLSFETNADAAIETLLSDRYGAYKDASYWLRVVVTLLSDLHSIYPGATLHDCDDGSDVNPVRLDSTALGNYPLRTPPT